MQIVVTIMCSVKQRSLVGIEPDHILNAQVACAMFSMTVVANGHEAMSVVYTIMLHSQHRQRPVVVSNIYPAI